MPPPRRCSTPSLGRTARRPSTASGAGSSSRSAIFVRSDDERGRAICAGDRCRPRGGVRRLHWEGRPGGLLQRAGLDRRVAVRSSSDRTMSEDVRFARVIDAAPEEVFDAFTGKDGQEAFYSERGWIVESQCDLRVGGVWTVTFGPSRDELYRHDHVFRVIDRPSRLLVDTTESRPDGSIVDYETEFIFEERDGKTLMTMIHRGVPTAELRDEH